MMMGSSRDDPAPAASPETTAFGLRVDPGVAETFRQLRLAYLKALELLIVS